MSIRDFVFAVFAIANLIVPDLILYIHFTVVQVLVKDKHCVNLSMVSFWIIWAIEMMLVFGVTFYVFWQFELAETTTRIKQASLAIFMAVISVGVFITWSFMLDRPFNCLGNVSRFMADETGPAFFWIFYLIKLGAALWFIRTFKNDARDIRVFTRFKHEAFVREDDIIS
jgi:hypothetical protein